MTDSLKESYLKYRVCVVCNVPQSEAPNVMYAKFPKNINRCRKWIRVIGNVKLLQLSLKKIQYRYVCGNHFERSHFTKSGKHLTKEAVPTILPPDIKPLTKGAVKLFPPLVTRSSSKVLLHCTQRIVPINRDTEVMSPTMPEPNSPASTNYEYLEEEYLEPYEEQQMVTVKQEVLDRSLREPMITIKQEALDPSLRDCVPHLIPVLHHNLFPESQTTEIYAVTKDRQVVPITTKVMKDGKDCVIEMSQKKVQIRGQEAKVIPVSNEVLSSILRKDCDVTVEAIGYRKSSSGNSTLNHSHPKKRMETQREEELQKKIQTLQRRNRQLKRMLRIVGIIDEIESPHIKKVIEKAIVRKQLSVGIKEFTKDRQLAISILKRALTAYHYLSYLIPLPNVCALQNISMKDPVYSNTTKCKHLL